MITLKTLEQASEKEVFEQVKTHLLSQGTRSIGEDGKCAYLGFDGKKCAAGCFIGDDEYKPSIEGNSWGWLANGDMVPANHSSLISALQKVHDISFPRDWEYELNQIAIRRGIEP